MRLEFFLMMAMPSVGGGRRFVHGQCFWLFIFAGSAWTVIMAEQLCVKREMTEGLPMRWRWVGFCVETNPRLWDTFGTRQASESCRFKSRFGRVHPDWNSMY
ncbi:hypothetical protein L210DRAFT_3574636 [Boletus edulis BED1]|uniref:Uncharacterized protein n=1 Tax=Boletus edulis BED1 TaxID=1328754 RepID=A0AAD4G6W3_BOLED|nr:hypothetical protein L210DRAFT_3574636 [Boletus edulis BED1]